MNNDIETIGHLTFDANGIPYFCFGETENGYCYKDAIIYKQDWDETCYIPESSKPDLPSMKENGRVYNSFDGSDCYSHSDLLRICYGNHALCDFIFQELSWERPGMLLENLGQHSKGWRHFYNYVQEGARLWWNDPARETCGWVTVEKVPPTEELLEVDWDNSTVIVVSYGCSIAEVQVCELTLTPFLINAPSKPKK